MISLGPSAAEAPLKKENDVEVFGIQYTWKYFKASIDRAFVMDDEEWILAKNHSFDNPIDIEQEMRDFGKDIYVSKKWKNVLNTVEYPVDKIVDHFKIKYFMNSIAYMFALAIYEGFERIETYGIDNRYFTDTGGKMNYNHNWLDETHCVEFWAGVAVGRGVEVVTTKRSSLMKPVYPGDPSMYGYELSPELKRQRDNILAKRERVKRKLEPTTLSFYRKPEDMSYEELERKIAVGAIKPKAENVKAQEWGDVPVPDKKEDSGVGN